MKKLIMLISVVGGMALVIFHPALAPYRYPESLATYLTQLQLHWWAAPAYVLAYILAVILSFPGSVITLAGGVAFGFVKGSLLVILASNIGAVLAFLVGRYVGRDFAKNLILKIKGLSKLMEGAEANGFQTILVLRLAPIFPFNAINYASGLSGIKLKDYFLGSVIGMLPGTLVYIYFASSLTSGVTGAKSEAMTHILISSVLLISLSFVPLLIKKYKLKNNK
jgi:uncharacterized membrane protein YdjX (TVP38/TMEM64 family)